MQLIQQTYTSWYNRTYKRSGHVFEQRYKSILCDKDSYLLCLSIGQRSNFIFELLLKPNTTYALTFDNEDATDADFHFNLLFYETFN